MGHSSRKAAFQYISQTGLVAGWNFDSNKLIKKTGKVKSFLRKIYFFTHEMRGPILGPNLPE
jgi:hypothetical protein